MPDDWSGLLDSRWELCSGGRWNCQQCWPYRYRHVPVCSHTFEHTCVSAIGHPVRPGQESWIRQKTHRSDWHASDYSWDETQPDQLQATRWPEGLLTVTLAPPKLRDHFCSVAWNWHFTRLIKYFSQHQIKKLSFIFGYYRLSWCWDGNINKKPRIWTYTLCPEGLMESKEISVLLSLLSS